MNVSGAGVGPCTGGTFTWRRQDHHVVTLVGKVEVPFDAQGDLGAIAAAPLLLEPQREEGGLLAGVRLPSDVARPKPCGEVLVVGRARWGSRQSEAQLGLYLTRGSIPLVSKRLTVRLHDADDGVSLRWENARGGTGVDANPIGRPDAPIIHPHAPLEPIGLGPLDRAWGARKALLGGAQVRPRARVNDAPPDGAYFQDAPADQRIVGPLLPGDVVTLDHLVAASPRVQWPLPKLHGRARLWRDGEVAEDLALAIDTLLIDLDAGTLTVVARGEVVLSGAEDLRAWIALGPEAPRWPVEPPRAEDAPTSEDLPAAGGGAPTLPVAAKRGDPARTLAPFAVARPGTSPAKGPLPGAPWGGASTPVLPAQPGAAQTLAPFGVDVRVASTEPPGTRTLPVRPSPQSDPSTPLHAAMLARKPSSEAAAEASPIPDAPWSPAPPAQVPTPEPGQSTLPIDPSFAAARETLAAELRAREEAAAEARHRADEEAREVAAQRAQQEAKEAAREAERRREAEAFEREQRALAEAEARRQAEKVARVKEQAEKLREGMYGGFGKK